MDGALARELAARLAPLGALRARPMFGGVGLYCDDVFFGLIMADALYFKVDERSVEAYRAAGSAPFRPFPERPDSSSLGYFEVPLGVQERDEELRVWAARAVEAARRSAEEKKARRKGSKGRRERPEPVSRLENVGPRTAAWLRAAGIATRADLERLGAVQAYREVVAAGCEPTLELLYALEGARLGLRADRLPEVVKENLRERLRG